MPKSDWTRKNKYYIQHNTKDVTIGIYKDGVLLFVKGNPVGELMKKVSEAIKHYDENHKDT